RQSSLLGVGSTCRARDVSHAAQLLSIGEHDRQQPPERPAIPDWLQSDGNFIARLKGLLGITGRDDVGSTLSLDDPVYRLAVFIFDVEPQKAMRIGPKPFRDGTLQSKFFRGVE